MNYRTYRQYAARVYSARQRGPHAADELQVPKDATKRRGNTTRVMNALKKMPPSNSYPEALTSEELHSFTIAVAEYAGLDFVWLADELTDRITLWAEYVMLQDPRLVVNEDEHYKLAPASGPRPPSREGAMDMLQYERKQILSDAQRMAQLMREQADRIDRYCEWYATETDNFELHEGYAYHPSIDSRFASEIQGHITMLVTNLRVDSMHRNTVNATRYLARINQFIEEE